MVNNLFENPDEQHVVSSQQPAAPLPQYTCDANRASRLFADHGFRVAPGTIRSYCRSNLLDCEKFVNGNVTKWKITHESIDERIETLKREGVFPDSFSQLQPAELSIGSSELQPAKQHSRVDQVLELLKEELKEKNKQISEFHSIIHAQNKQFENLNQTIQLSNQTIQQLNKTLALPQMKDYVTSTRENGDKDYHYNVEVDSSEEQSIDRPGDEERSAI